MSGALGICSGGGGVFGGIINLAASSTLTEVTTATMTPAQRADYTEYMNANQLPTALGSALALVNLIVSVLLLWGSVVCLQSKQVKTKVLSMGLAACMVHGILAALISIFNFFWLKGPMAKYMESVSQTPGAAELDINMSGIASASMGIGIALDFSGS